MAADGDSQARASPPSAAASALRQLRALAEGAKSERLARGAEPGPGPNDAAESSSSTPATAAAAPPPLLDPDNPVLWVERTPAWRADTARKLSGLLAATLPRLAAAQQSPATRAAVAQGTATASRAPVEQGDVWREVESVARG